MAIRSELFPSFFLAGFDSCCQIEKSGRRLDLLAQTRHDRFVREDYGRLRELGIRTVRSGIRWHLVEPTPGRYDFSSLLPTLRAARETRTQVIYDLAHYGWPSDLDIYSTRFVDRFADYARAVARVIGNETDATPFFVPVNEPSFWAWAADVGYFYPFTPGHGMELKAQLVRAAVHGIEAIWSVQPQARIVHVDPLIHVVSGSDDTVSRQRAERENRNSFQAWDMVAGRMMPELGGAEKYLDIMGVNFYPHNEWQVETRQPIYRDHPQYRPLSELLREIFERYRRPFFISETGAENDARVEWLSYVSAEVRAARQASIPVQGICLYPILNYPCWESDRYCEHGLWGDADENGERPLYEPLARELKRQMISMEHTE